MKARDRPPAVVRETSPPSPYGDGSFSPGPSASAPARRRSTVPWLLAAALLFVLAEFFLLAWLRDHGSDLVGDSFHGGGDPDMSPDGSTIVYASPRTGNGDLYLVNRDGSGTRRLTSDPTEEHEPRFSPDGRRIVFVRVRGLASHLWIVNADGSQPRQITFGSAEDAYPEFSPDGKRVLFTRSVWKGGLALFPSPYEIAFDGGQLRQLLPEGNLSGTYFPGGKRICFSGGSPQGIWSMNRDRSGKRFLGEGSAPAVSPDSRRILFPGEPYNQSLWIMNADGSARRQIYAGTGYIARPAFTPDGRQILFLAQDDPNGTGEIMLLNVDGSGARAIGSNR
jgi:Tol biopolymer transport system component